MNTRTTLLVALLLALILAACSASAGGAGSSAPASLPTAISTDAGSGAGSMDEDLMRVDEQGAVVVAVTPLNLTSPADTLDFEIALNTHSVDLSMDLTALAILSTDAGVSVPPTGWDGPMGGHHVSGVLSFPAVISGTPLLQNATRLTLTIRD